MNVKWLIELNSVMPTVECQSPFEIRYEDGSFATGAAAYIVLEYIKSCEEEE